MWEPAIASIPRQLLELVRDAAFVSPGIKWKPDENGVIVFDCRNRGW